MIAGFEIRPAAHRARRTDLTAVQAYQRNIDMVFQNYALFPHMTAPKRGRFALKMRRFPRRENDRSAPARKLDLVRPRALRRTLPARALRRPAAARRAGARARFSIPTCCCSTSRSARSTRSCASRCRSRSGVFTASCGHDDLRDARPDRGDDHVGPRRGLSRRPASNSSARRSTVYDRPANRFVAANSSATAISSLAHRSGALPAPCEQAGIGADTRRRCDRVQRRRHDHRRALHHRSPRDEQRLDMTIDNIINYGNSILVIGSDARPATARPRVSGTTPPHLRRGVNPASPGRRADPRISARGRSSKH